MRTQREIEHATIDSHLQTSSMGMELNATSFNHIISNLYRNPLGAVFRELTTNAIEAHVDAKTDRRVAIQLPSPLSQEFIIRDFGKGLSHEDVMKYLNTLFSSSKSGDNEARGGFGLGSKSPLALVDSFHLTSVHNGVKNTYAWIREGGKLPTLIRMGDEEDFDEKTKEDSGITINIPLGSSSKLNISQLTTICNTEARRQLFAFTKEMILITDNINEPNYEDLTDITDKILLEERVLSLDNIDIFKISDSKQQSVLKPYYVTVGDVAYPLEHTSAFNNITKYFKDSRQYTFAIKAPIGSLDIPMSREEVLTTHNNNTVIADLASKAVADVQNHIKSLNINLDCSITDFYDQIKNNVKKSGSVEFLLDIDEDAFKKHETTLVKDYHKIYTSLNPSTSHQRYATLTYSDVKRGTLPHTYLPTLLSKMEDLDQVKMFLYAPDLKSRTRIRDPYYSRSDFRMNTDAYSFILTSLPLTPGLSNVDIERYIENKLKPTQQVVLIQVRETALPFVQRSIEIGLKVQEVTAGLTEVSQLLPVINPDDVKLFKTSYKASLKVTGTVSRSTYDFVPGLRIHSLFAHHVYTNVGKTFSVDTDDKVFKLLNSDGKTIGVGPEYLADAKVDVANPVFLIKKGEELPLDTSAFVDTVLQKNVFDVACSTVRSQLSKVTLVTVQERSFDKTLERFEEDGKYTVYHAKNLFQIERKTIKDLPLDHKLYLVQPVLKEVIFEELFRQSAFYSYRDVNKDLYKLVSTSLLKSLERVYKHSPLLAEVSPSFANKGVKDFLESSRPYGLNLLTVSFDKDSFKKQLVILPSVFKEELTANTALKNHIIELVRNEILKEDVLRSYIQQNLK